MCRQTVLYSIPIGIEAHTLALLASKHTHAKEIKSKSFFQTRTQQAVMAKARWQIQTVLDLAS